MDTQVTFVLDSSGSMSSIRADTIGGFNAFLADQRDEPGTAAVTLVEFDTTVEVTYTGRPVGEAPTLDEETYRPGGSTALHDAIVTAIETTRSHVEAMAAATRPDDVVVVVLTDGKENASETPQETVRERVEARQADGWEFLFVGANQDAALTAAEMGVDRDKSLNYAANSEGTDAVYESTSEKVKEVRRTGSTDGFDEADRKRQDDAR